MCLQFDHDGSKFRPMGRPIRGVAAIQVSEDIVPIAEFKVRLSEVVRGLPARRRPVVITQNGKPAAVVLSPAEFDRLSYHARLVAAVDEGLADVADGRVIADDDLGKLLDERFGTTPKPKRTRR